MNTPDINVHPVERAASAVLGGALLLRGPIYRAFVQKALGIALLYRGVSGHSYLYQALGMSTAGNGALSGSGPTDGSLELVRSITIERPADDLYLLWIDQQNLSQIMGDALQVTMMDQDRIHWEMQGPLNQRISWDSQIVEDRPGELLRWSSPEGASLSNEGELRFQRAPADWGTVVTLRFRFVLPGGAPVRTVMGGLGLIPRTLLEKILRRYKSLAETGEIPTLQHNPSARVAAVR